LLVVAITFGTINIIGGFFVTDRMLDMFKRKPEKPPGEEAASSADGGKPER
jgi:H+-translocating NAD(P) transhydrogenase subunit alpha